MICVNNVYHRDCMEGMKEMPDKSVNLTLTDIPYDFFQSLHTTKNREYGSTAPLRIFNKGVADIVTFELKDFLQELIRITKGSICVFCGFQQFSHIYSFFSDLKIGTVRPIVWHKKNPLPMNGKYVYLQATEFAVWYRPPGAAFNCFCKGNVFNFPQGSSENFPTQKNLALWEEIILDNSNELEIIFDPCMGSGTTAIAALRCNRNFLGFELDEDAYRLIKNRLEENILYSLSDKCKCL